MTRREGGGKDETLKSRNRETEARGTLSLRVKFKLKLPMQAERGSADLDFNWLRAAYGADALFKV